jgi:hypothetical protein
VEDLFVGCAAGSTDAACLIGASQVLDVREHDRGPIRLSLVLLPAAQAADMRGYAGVDEDVVFAGVPIDV